MGAVEGCTEVGAVRRSSGRDQCVGEVGRRCMWSSVIEHPVEVAAKNIWEEAVGGCSGSKQWEGAICGGCYRELDVGSEKGSSVSEQWKGAVRGRSGRISALEQYVGAVGGRSGKGQSEGVVAWGSKWNRKVVGSSKWNRKVVGSSTWELWKGAVVGSDGREQQWEGAVRRSNRS